MRFTKNLSIATIIGALLFLLSCEKNETVRYTSDFQNQYTTNIEVNYLESLEKTQVFVLFFKDNDLTFQSLKLPEDASITVNGIDLTDQEFAYTIEFEGKPNCTIELKDIDGKIYRNTLYPVDTAYFINFPDSISAGSEFDFEVNAPILDSSESSSICRDISYLERDCIYTNSLDSVFTFFSTFYDDFPHNTLYFQRQKRIKKPNLPQGGGIIQYNYIVEKQY